MTDSDFLDDRQAVNKRAPIPAAQDVIGLPAGADMQYMKKAGKDILRVFYRYRGKNVPDLIKKEREALRIKAIKAGRIPSEFPEVRLYLGIVENLVFHPSPDFSAHPENFPLPTKSNRGLRSAKIASEIQRVRSLEFNRLTESEASYSLSVGANVALMNCLKDNGVFEDFHDALYEVLPTRSKELFHPALTLVLYMAQAGVSDLKLEEWCQRRLVPAGLTQARANEIVREIGLVHDELKEAYETRRLARIQQNHGRFIALHTVGEPDDVSENCRNGKAKNQPVTSYLFVGDTSELLASRIFSGDSQSILSIDTLTHAWDQYGLRPQDVINVFDRSWLGSDLRQLPAAAVPVLVEVGTDLHIVHRAIFQARGLKSRQYQIPGSSLFGNVVPVLLDEQDSSSRSFLHIFRDPIQQAEYTRMLDSEISEAVSLWNLGQGRLPSHMKPFFAKPVKGQSLMEKTEIIDETYRLAGISAFLSNTIQDSTFCLSTCRLKSASELCLSVKELEARSSAPHIRKNVLLQGNLFLNSLAVTAVSSLFRKSMTPSKTRAPSSITRKEHYQQLLSGLDGAFIFKNIKCAPNIQFETDSCRALLNEVGLTDQLTNSQKLIAMMTDFPSTTDAASQ